MKEKYFIITVDTEGDNLWSYTPKKVIRTENSKYINRFQRLCDSFSFKPVYLTNYEMACSDIFVKESTEWLATNRCEIGLHLHAWNNPPIVNDGVPDTGCQYLIEYSEDIMDIKFKELYYLIKKRFGVTPISHRAGRWAMNEKYFKLLKKYNVFIDCSVTPGIDWSNAIGGRKGGTNYMEAKLGVDLCNSIWEIPPTVRKMKRLGVGTFKHQIKNFFYPDTIWLRPAMCSLKSMLKLVDFVEYENDCDYLEFMIHSSELMPGGSPYFTTEDSVDKEYETITKLFEYIHSKGYVGVTLQEYARIHRMI